MGALSFMGQFVPKVEAGLRNEPGGKRQSMRNFRRRPLKVGERLYLYFAQRSKWCKKLGESRIAAFFIVGVTETGIRIYTYRNDEQASWRWDLIAKSPRKLAAAIKQLKLVQSIRTSSDLDAFAKADGFDNWATMKRWWQLTHGTAKKKALPWFGNLYKW